MITYQREITLILKRDKSKSISAEVNKKHFKELNKYKNTVIDTNFPTFINLFSSKANLLGRTTSWEISLLLKQLNINRGVSLKIFLSSQVIKYMSFWSLFNFKSLGTIEDIELVKLSLRVEYELHSNKK